jgi:hypothetical protein
MAGNYDGYLAGLQQLDKEPLLDSVSGAGLRATATVVYRKTDQHVWKMIEGIQDYEKINILKEEFKNKNNKSKLEKLNTLFLHSPRGLTKADPTQRFNRQERN